MTPGDDVDTRVVGTRDGVARRWNRADLVDHVADPAEEDAEWVHESFENRQDRHIVSGSGGHEWVLCDEGGLVVDPDAAERDGQ